MTVRGLSLADLPPDAQAKVRAQINPPVNGRSADGIALGPNSPLLKRAGEKTKPRQLEDAEQLRVFQWVAQSLMVWPELRWLHHIPNGGKRDKRTAGRLKALGVKSGVPDLCFPNRRGKYVGCYIELKSGNGASPTTDQLDWLCYLREQGWLTSVEYGADDAIRRLKYYLNLSPVTP